MSEGDEGGAARRYPRLPPGRHGLGQEYVMDHQRRRLVVAMAELTHEVGMAGVTVGGLTSRARVSRKSFYDCFATREECLDYTAARAAAYLFESLDETRSERPEDDLNGAVEALLGTVAAEPKLAELALIHAPAMGGERGRRAQEMAIAGIAQLLGPDEPADSPGMETIASAIIGVIACRIRRGEAELAGELVGEVMCLAKLPASGVDALEG